MPCHLETALKGRRALRVRMARKLSTEVAAAPMLIHDTCNFLVNSVKIILINLVNKQYFFMFVGKLGFQLYCHCSENIAELSAQKKFFRVLQKQLYFCVNKYYKLIF